MLYKILTLYILILQWIVRGNLEEMTYHHHCSHDLQVDKLLSSINLDSLHSPQIKDVETFSGSRLTKSQSTEADYFISRYLSIDATAEAATSPNTFKPFRIAFDLSKLSDDPGFMCTKEAEIIDVDGQEYSCLAEDVLTPAKKDFMVFVLLKAIRDYFENTLSVERVEGNLQIKGLSCNNEATWACCSTSFPTMYQSPGIPDADYLLHVTARPTVGSTIAWALPCNVDQYGRPVSGQANFGPLRLDPLRNRKEQIGTALHEVTHALVFSKSRFEDFRQPMNGPKWGINNVVSQSTTSGNIYISKIITPQVVKQIKTHFNCMNWVDAGVDLENGKDGTAEYSSHWDKRMVMNEYMSPTASYDPIYSALTLALFEDSGWYQVSYDAAEILPWGFMEGCGFAQSKCTDWNSQYICSDSEQTSCTADRASKAYCNIVRYSSSIPTGFQYFQDPQLGGGDSYADYCPFYRAFSNGDCRGIGRVETLVNKDYIEATGPQSKCFISSLSKKFSENAAMRPTCYTVLGCSSDSLRILVGDIEVKCPISGGVDLKVDGLMGKIQCPTSANRICQIMQDKCSGAGVLLTNGKCECRPGYVGEDCSGIACPRDEDGNECGGKDHGQCDYKIGICTCSSSYIGLACTELVCPSAEDGKAIEECSGHGTCNRSYGTCSCTDSYGGKACECVPGCSTPENSCTSHGACDCMTGACACSTGYSGVKCEIKEIPMVYEVTEDSGVYRNSIAEKAYSYFKIYLAASTYDITIVLTNLEGQDADLYGSFDDSTPNSLSSKSSLFVSNTAGMRDEIHLCGSLGNFPRGINSTFRSCTRPTSAYILNAPGYLYFSVLGFTSGEYTITIETDKCRNVSCSNHGICGRNYPGVCTCDRYWTGEDCSTPKCGPDCNDLGTCFQSNLFNPMPERFLLSQTNLSIEQATSNFDAIDQKSSLLKNTSECYGNGICQVNEHDQPLCLCDEPFLFENPTAEQALCKDLLPSVASIERFTAPFRDSLDEKEKWLDLNEWSLYTIVVSDTWEILVVNLQVTTNESDAMLFISKETLPNPIIRGDTTVLNPATKVRNAHAQFQDLKGWTSSSPIQKIVLNRASSTLSSGLYYIGVLNSGYARAPLGYLISVNATSDCSESSGDFGICEGEVASCVATRSPFCVCRGSYVGDFCDILVTRVALPTISPVANATSIEAYKSQDNTLAINEWSYFSFDVTDPNVAAAAFTLEIKNPSIQMDKTANPVVPIMLIRGPDENAFPNLFIEGLQDFDSISNRKTNQSIVLPVNKVCSFMEQGRDCYKVAIYNRPYSGETLHYKIHVQYFRNISYVYPKSETCELDGSSVNCYGKGTCIDVVNKRLTGKSHPSCQCNNGWTGIRCNTPIVFDLPQLWTAISSMSVLCSSCSTDFELSHQAMRLFRMPAILQEDKRVRLRVRTKGGNNNIVPNIYVSEVAPRSMYDFLYISTSSNHTPYEQELLLPRSSISGHFWVIVYSAYPASEDVHIIGSADSSSASTGAEKLGNRILQTSDDKVSGTFHLSSELYTASPSSTPKVIITDTTFAGAVFNWVCTTTSGQIIFGFMATFIILMLLFSIWRIFYAPENQDQVTKEIFGPQSHQQNTSTHNHSLSTIQNPSTACSPHPTSHHDTRVQNLRSLNALKFPVRQDSPTPSAPDFDEEDNLEYLEQGINVINPEISAAGHKEKHKSIRH